MKNIYFLTLVLGLAAFLQGCGRIDIEIEKLPVLGPSLFVFKYGEFVSGSSQRKTTAVSGYKVEVSTGTYNSTIKQVSPNGYTVFTSVQGANLSQQE